MVRKGRYELREMRIGEGVGKDVFIELDIVRDKNLVCKKVEKFIAFLVRWIPKEYTRHTPGIEFISCGLRVIGKCQAPKGFKGGLI